LTLHMIQWLQRCQVVPHTCAHPFSTNTCIVDQAGHSTLLICRISALPLPYPPPHRPRLKPRTREPPQKPVLPAILENVEGRNPCTWWMHSLIGFAIVADTHARIEPDAFRCRERVIGVDEANTRSLRGGSWRGRRRCRGMRGWRRRKAGWAWRLGGLV